jgi:hypothetical protein
LNLNLYNVYNVILLKCLNDQFSDQLSFWVLGSFSVGDCYYCAERVGDDYSFLVLVHGGVDSVYNG